MTSPNSPNQEAFEELTIDSPKPIENQTSDCPYEELATTSVDSNTVEQDTPAGSTFTIEDSEDYIWPQFLNDTPSELGSVSTISSIATLPEPVALDLLENIEHEIFYIFDDENGEKLSVCIKKHMIPDDPIINKPVIIDLPSLEGSTIDQIEIMDLCTIKDFPSSKQNITFVQDSPQGTSSEENDSILQIIQDYSLNKNTTESKDATEDTFVNNYFLESRCTIEDNFEEDSSEGETNATNKSTSDDDNSVKKIL